MCGGRGNEESGEEWRGEGRGDKCLHLSFPVLLSSQEEEFEKGQRGEDRIYCSCRFSLLPLLFCAFFF